MAIHSRQELADFALRQLGGGIVNIEVTPEQLEDAITLCMRHYHEYHFDGIVRDYMVHKITGTQVTLADATGLTRGMTLVSVDSKTRALIDSVNGNVVTINHQLGYEKFQVGTVVATPNGTSTITNIVLGDVDKGYVEAGDNIVGVTRLLNVTNILGSADYMFNVQYQVMMSEIQALTKAGTSMYWQTMNYLGHIDFVMKKEKNYEFNRRMNRLYIEVSWSTEMNVGDIIVAEVYRAVDEESFPEVYDDIWVGKYTTALVKKQWGTNMKKYSGIQLPGGITYSGQQIFDEAMQEIATLEAEALYSTSPLLFMVG